MKARKESDIMHMCDDRILHAGIPSSTARVPNGPL